MGFFNNFIDTYKETKRRNASYYRSYDNSKKIKGKRNKVLDYVFSDIQRKTELGRYCIEIPSWTSVYGGINLYNEIIKEEEYFKSKGFDFKVKNRGDFGKIIKISWWREVE